MTSSPISSRHAFKIDIIRRPLSKFARSMLIALGVSVFYPPALAEEVSVGHGLPATPLVLKDGRITRVSVHTIPFPDDAAALASTTANELEIFTQAMATDCFLTAQVIGHVDKNETSGRDTVDIHRLARARADTIQDSLIANGLPAASIASVWDWQFMVQDARATLWIFRLAAGDDCEDKALSPATGDQVADLPPEEKPAQAVAEAELLQPEPAPEEQVKSVQQRVVAAAKTKAPQITKPIPASLPKPAVATGQQAKPANASSTNTSDPVQLSAASPKQQQTDKEGRVVITEDGALEITFATNSSYFPQGWSEPSRAFLDRLDEGASYVVHVQTTIDGGASVAGTSSEDEAARYNKWLADRRFERVKTWLINNSEGRTLQIEPKEISNDGSRRVIVELNPLG